MAPAADMMARRLDEHAEAHLAILSHRGNLASSFVSSHPRH